MKMFNTTHGILLEHEGRDSPMSLRAIGHGAPRSRRHSHQKTPPTATTASRCASSRRSSPSVPSSSRRRRRISSGRDRCPARAPRAGPHARPARRWPGLEPDDRAAGRLRDRRDDRGAAPPLADEPEPGVRPDSRRRQRSRSPAGVRHARQPAGVAAAEVRRGVERAPAGSHRRAHGPGGAGGRAVLDGAGADRRCRRCHPATRAPTAGPPPARPQAPLPPIGRRRQGP